MNAVTGIGPRTGTSWVMGKLKDAGLQVNGHKFIPDLLVPQHNPLGYWELDPREPTPTTGISKLWRIWDKGNIDKVVVLERLDVQAQLQSIEKVFQDELKLEAYKSLLQRTPKDILLEYVEGMNNWLNNRDPKKTMLVYTENLNNEISKIINFFKEE